MTANLAIMLSGGGRTMVNIAAAIQSRQLPARITAVIASRECAGCTRAKELGLDTQVIKGEIPAPDLEKRLRAANADWLVLAGYLKKVNIPASFRHKAVNIHPALLPAFGGPGMYGHHVHEAVLARGCKVSGCTVHLLDEHYDNGPILVQRTCPVLDGDTAETLAARVFEQECIAYPEALRHLIAGRVRIEGNVARILPAKN